MTDQLIASQTVIRFGRERTQHNWRVAVVGDDATGYRVQVQTTCGRVVETETTSKVQGFVTCAACKPSPEGTVL